MLGRLHDETWGHHADAEADRLVILQHPSTARYCDYLADLYGLEAPIESAYALTPGMSSLVDLRARSRAGLLAADLLDLGETPARIAQLPMYEAVTRFDGLPEALGWMYALERSAQHRSFLLHRLMRLLPGALTRANRYLASCETAWDQLGDEIDRVAISRPIRDRIIAAAHEAFEAQRAWFHRADQTLVEDAS